VSAAAPRERIFCACAPGLEPVLAGELRGLGLEARDVPGGAEAEGEDAAALACLASRVADAVRLRLWEGPATALDDGRREVRAILGKLAPIVRVERGHATLSVDVAGEPLYKRGWRARIGAAPLRESLAAGVLLACGWTGDTPFLDPMCGSGTLAIEAALLAGRRAPGLGRSFAFERLPGHDVVRTARLRDRLAAEARPIAVPIHASDRNGGAVRLAGKNADAAGVAAAIRIVREDAARAVPPPGAGLCAVNLPYGIRLEEDASARVALEALLPRLAGWDLAVLAPARGPAPLPLAPVSELRVRNGGIPCRLLRYRP
jgi:putative N6-adenine-specific DNA methylase